jgi:hypothetical protein
MSCAGPSDTTVDGVYVLDYSRTRVGGKTRPTMTHQLAAKCVLIVEDEPLIADHIAYQVTAEGAE